MIAQTNTLEDVEIEIRDQAPGHRAHLPTFPWEEGWREFYDEEQGKLIRTPLTLSDIVCPVEEEDIGTLHMIHNPDHNHWRDKIANFMTSYLDKNWIILNDIFVRWPYPGVPSTAADITVIPIIEKYAMFGEYAGQNPYVVKQNGLLPLFIIEITSALTRPVDLSRKPLVYAAKGVWEYLIIDMMTPEDEDWQLIGYFLDEEPFYYELEPDEDGGLVFESVGLRFVPVGRERIDIYDDATGELLSLT